MFNYIVFISKNSEKEIGFLYSVNNIDELRDALVSLKNKFSDYDISNYATHVLNLDKSINEKTLKEYDPYFENITFFDSVELFIREIKGFSAINSIDVASHLLAVSGHKLRPFKLIKTVYYIYADLLEKNNKEPFTSHLEAWDYGPVDPDVYHAYYQDDKLDVYDSLIPKINNNQDLILLKEIDRLARKYKSSFDNIGKNPTHREGTPWKRVFKPVANAKITNESIIRYHHLESINDV